MVERNTNRAICDIFTKISAEFKRDPLKRLRLESMSRIVLADRYELTEQIGIGSHCRVYLARDLNTNGLFACKKIDYGNIAVEIQPIIEREVQLTRQLDHPNIIKYYEILQDEALKVLYVIADYFKHGSIAAYVQSRHTKGQKMDEDSIWMIIAQLADVLSFCHSPDKSYYPELGIVLHRNINPESIYLKDDGTVVLGGFSMAESLGKKVAAATRIGIANYMSPEMLSNRAYDYKADIWSLGCTIYEICTNEQLFKGKDASEILRELRTSPSPYILPGYTEELSKVVSAMLEYNPDKRPSALQLLQHPTVERMWQMYRGYLDVGVGVDNRDATENVATLHFNCSPDDQQQMAGTIPCPACNRTGYDCQTCNGTGLISAAPNQADAIFDISRVEPERTLEEMELESSSRLKRGTKKPPKSKLKGKKSTASESNEGTFTTTGMSEGKSSRSSSQKRTSRTSSRSSSRGVKKAPSRLTRARSNSATAPCCRSSKANIYESMEEQDLLDAPSILRKDITTVTNPTYEDVVAVQGTNLNESNLLPGNRLVTGYLHPTETVHQFTQDGSVPPPTTKLTRNEEDREGSMLIAGENYQLNVQNSFREGIVNGHGRDIGTPMTNTPSYHSSFPEPSNQYPQSAYHYQPVESDARVLSPGVQDLRLRTLHSNVPFMQNSVPTLTPPSDRPVFKSNTGVSGFQQNSYATPYLSQVSQNTSLIQNSIYGSTPMAQPYCPNGHMQQLMPSQPQIQSPHQQVYVQMHPQQAQCQPISTYAVRTPTQVYAKTPDSSFIAQPVSTYGASLQVSNSHGLLMNASGRRVSRRM